MTGNRVGELGVSRSSLTKGATYTQALTALRHKPAEQSFEGAHDRRRREPCANAQFCLAYSLDLRASFPLQDADNDVHAVSSEWRARALQLEGKLRDMEKKQEGDALGTRIYPPHLLV